MTDIQSLEDLDQYRQSVIEKKARLAKSGMIQAVVSMGSCGIAAGANQTYAAVQDQIQQKGLRHIIVSKTGCIGLCSDEPILEVITSDGQKTTYAHVTPDVVEQIFNEHILGGNIVREHQIIL